MQRFKYTLGASIVPACLLLMLAGCANDLSIPADAQITCEDGGSACPDGFVCNEVLGECVKVGSGDTVAPEVLTKQVSPDPARAGLSVIATFTVNETLARDPEVLLLDSADANFTLRSKESTNDGETYEFIRLVTGSESQMTHEVQARNLVDRNGNVTPSATLGSVTFDFEPPDVSDLSPPERGLVPAARGADLVVQFTVSEDLGDTEDPSRHPALALVDASGAEVAQLAYESHDPETRRYRYTISIPQTGLAEGEHGVRVEATDAAGNPGSAVHSGLWRLDFEPPEASQLSVTPAMAGPGTRVFARFEVDEPLAATPAVELRPAAGGDPIPMEALTPQGLLYTYQYTTATGQDDAYTAVLFGLTDAAGNTTDQIVLGQLTIDTVAPVFTNDPPVTLIGDGLHVVDEQVGVRFSTSEPVTVEAFVDFGARRVNLAPAAPQVEPLEFTHLPTQGDPEASGMVVVRITDLAGNPGEEQKLGPVVFDFSPPEVISGTPSPSDAKLGDVLVYSVSVNETLSTTTPPALHVGPVKGGADLSMGLPAVSGTLFTWTLAVDGSIAEDDYVASIDVTDVAGNAAVGVTGNLQGFSVDATRPAITVHDVPRTLVRSGQDVELSFTVSEPLAKDPVVKLGDIQMDKDAVASSGLDYVYRHPTAGSEPQKAYGLSVQLEDEAGNTSNALLPESVTLDFSAPSVVSAQASPAKAKLGADVIISVTVSEDLAAVGGIALRCEPDPGFALQGQAGRSFSWVHRVTAGDAAGDHVFHVTLEDPAGNNSGELSDVAWTFEIDNTQPDVTDVELGRLLPDDTLAEAYVKRNDTLETRFGTTKPLAEDPVVKTGPYPMTGGWDDVLGKYRYAYTFGTDEDEGSHAVTAELTDLADNVRFVNLGAVGVDNQAPGLIDSQASPTVAKLGATVALTLTVTEPIDVAQAPATFNIQVSAGLNEDFTYFGNVGLNYIFRHTVTDQDQPGDYTVQGFFCDLAGNCLAAPIDLAGFRIENEVPGVENIVLSPADGDVVAGEEVRVSFDVTKVLEGDPLISIGGIPMILESGDGTSFVFTYTTDGTEDEGRQVITAELHDPAGNVVFEELGRMRFDFTDPAAVASVASPDPARIDSVIIYTLNVSEDLGADPVLQINPVYVLDGPIQNGTVYRWTHLVAAGESDGTFTLSFDLCDLAGNCAMDVSQHLDLTPLAGLEVDATAPQTTAHSVTPTQLKAGEELRVTFTVSEALDDDPAVTLGAIAMIKDAGASSGNDYEYHYTPDGSEGDGTRTVSVQLLDPAGNLTNEIFAEAVEFDFTAPAIVSSVASPDPARLASLISYQVTVGETLANTPDLIGTPALAWTGPVQDGLNYTWTHTVAAGETATYTAELDQLCDGAGNCASNEPGVGFVVDADGPSTTAHSVSPVLVADGEAVTVSFTASEDLNSDPVVMLGDIAMSKTDQTGRDYTYGYTAQTADGDGVRTVSVQMVDPAGNQGSEVFAETVDFDFSAPGIISSVASPDPAKDGARITYQITVSETLTNVPDLTTTPALTWAGPAQNGLNYSWTHTVAAGETASYIAEIDQLCDAAGNCATGIAGVGFDVDADAPNTTVHSVSPALVKDGEVVTVTFTSDEDLNADPLVILGDITMSKTGQTGRDYTYTHTALTADGDGVRTVSIQLVDPAGNQGSEVFTETVEFDFSAPTIVSSVASPDPSKLGSVVTYQVTVSEALVNSPNLNSTPALVWAGPGQSGLSYTWTHTMAGGEDGGYTASIDQLCDAAGNCSNNPGGVGFTVDADPPDTTVHSVSPTLVKDGEVVTVTFTTDEALSGDPAVMLGEIVMSKTGQTGQDYTYAYTAQTADGGGVRTVSVQMVDLAGNADGEVFSETVEFDFSAPTIVSSVASPDPAKLGSVITYQITVSEGLTNSPNLATTPARAWAGPVQDGMNYSWTHTVGAGETGAYTAEIDQLCDTAGNCGTSVAGTGFDIDADAPSTTVHNVSPALVKDGEAVTVTFTSDEDLAADPVVTLGSIAMSKTDQTGRDYTYAYTAQTADGDGVRTVSVQMVDPAGNQGSEVFVETVEFDFVAPGIVSSVASPDPARLGSVITYQVTVGETLTNVPNLSTSPARAWAGPVQDGLNYFWTHTVGAGETGTYTASVDQLCDAAGNCDNLVPGTGFDIDADAPSTTAHNVSPTLVKDGEAVTVTFTSDEDLSADPVVTLGSIAMSKTDQTGRDYTYSYTAQTADDDGVRTVSVLMVDPAGNQGSEVFIETVEFDFVAPGIVSSVASPDPAKLGSVITYQITVGEALTNSPNLATTPARAWAGPSQNGLNYSWTHTVSAGETATYTAEIDQLCDAAGNCDTNVAGVGFDVDADAPGTTVHNVSPALVKDGEVVTVTFTPDEDLAADPVVTLGSITMNKTGQAGRDYTYTYTAQTADGDGVRTISVLMVDDAGNQGSEVFVETAEFDFVAPSIVSSIASPDPAKLGSVITYLATVSEPLSDSPNLVTTPARAWAGPAQNGLNYSWTHTVGVGETGTYTAEVDQLCDAASNCDTSVGGIGFDVDAITPTMSASDLIPVSGTKLGAGELIKINFDVTENLGLSAGYPKVTLGGYILNLQAVPDAGWDYTFTYTTTGGETEGVHTIVIELADDAGNTSTASAGNLELDYASPGLIATQATPASAKLGDTIYYDVTADEPLGPNPTLNISGPGSPSFTHVGGTKYKFEYITQAGDDGTYTVTIDLEDEAGNTANGLSQHIDLTPVAGFVIDADPPTISTITPNRPKYSQEAPYAAVSVGIRCDENVDTAPASLVVTIAGTTMDCGNYQPISPNYTCTHTVAGGEPEGPAIISVTAIDAAGNIGTASGSVELDYSAPVLASPVQFTRNDGNPRANAGLNDLYLSRTKYDGTGGMPEVAITFSVNEPLLLDPPVAVAGSAGAATKNGAQSSGQFYWFDFVQGGGEVDQDSAVTVTVTDAVGNSGPLALGTIRFDNTVPTLNAAMTDTMLYRRIPWGDDGHGGAHFEVPVSGTIEAEATLLVLDRANVSLASIIGKEYADGTGAVPTVTLTALDRDTVYALIQDRAGNMSAATALEIKEQEWIATMGGKVSGSTVENPHLYQHIAWLRDDNGQPPDYVSEPATVEIDKVQAIDATAATVTTPGSVLAWHQRWMMPDDSSHNAFVFDGQELFLSGQWSFDGADWRTTCGFSPCVDTAPTGNLAYVYDSKRRRIVAISTSGGFTNTWIWSESAWTQLAPPTALPARESANYLDMAYDAARDQVVLFGGNSGSDCGGGYCDQTWVFDGSDWTQLSPATSPPPRYLHGMTYDSTHQQVLLFGGRNSSLLGDTWTWDGSNWTPHTPGSSPSARSYVALADSPGDGGALLFGGNTVDPDPSDTWVWDGSDWNLRTPATVPTVGTSAGTNLGLALNPISGRVVLHGGDDSTTPPATWEWNGTNWTNLWQGTIGDVDSDPGAVFDDARGVVVTYAGYGSDVEGETYDWDDSGWTQTTPPGAAPGSTTKSGSRMVYDGGRGEVLLHGGYEFTYDPDCENYYNNTYTYAGVGWSSEPSGPKAADRMGLAYDSLRDVVVLFGGYGSNGFCNIKTFRETWEWNGASWTEVCTTAPCNTDEPTSTIVTMTYDRDRNQTVATDSNGTPVWEYNGTAWTKLCDAAPCSTSAPGNVRGMVYHRGWQRTATLSGGVVWLWDGSAWTSTCDTSPCTLEVPGLLATQLAYDSVRDTILGVKSGSDIRELWNAPDRRPGATMTADWSRANAATTLVSEVTLRGSAAGRGYDSGGSSVDGAALVARKANAWVPLDTNTAAPGSPAALLYTTASAAEAQAFLGPVSDTIAFRVQTASENGPDPLTAWVEADYLEVAVRYRRP